MAKMEWYDWVIISLILAGALNWGLVGAFDFNLVETIFTAKYALFIYILVGAAALVSIVRLARTFIK